MQSDTRITGRIAWLKGADNAGVVRYAPAAGITVPAFAKNVIGNFYARVETVVGYGARRSGSAAWQVFDTFELAREHASAMTHAAVAETSKSASA
jgi:hypothetical protein